MPNSCARHLLSEGLAEKKGRSGTDIEERVEEIVPERYIE